MLLVAGVALVATGLVFEVVLFQGWGLLHAMRVRDLFDTRREHAIGIVCDINRAMAAACGMGRVTLGCGGGTWRCSLARCIVMQTP